MIIVTAKVPKFKGGSVATMASVFCCLCLLFGLSKEPFQTAMSGTVDRMFHEDTVKNEKEARDYLEDLGWVVEETPLGVQTLYVPELLDESYQEYLALQTSQGFPSLEGFAGQKVTKYRFQVLNYPTGEEGVEVNLLCFDYHVIAGEVMSSQVGGFMHGLSVPDTLYS